jgi:phosphate transport system substrate-binding protein
MSLSGSSLLRLSLILAVLISAVTLIACSDDDDGGDDDGGNGDGSPTEPADGEIVTGSVDIESLSGAIAIDGSSTVYPITAAVAEEFGLLSDARVDVAFSGTGGGFEKFCAGEIEVSNASRPIKDDEVQACGEGGIPEDDIVELQVAIDALTVMVNPENDFVECLTVDQLHMIFKDGGASNWKDVDPSFPDQEISRYFPGVDSGTFDYFVEAVIEGVDENATHTGDGTPSEDDNVLAVGIENDPNAIGYFGFAYYQEAGQQLKAVQIDNGEGCVEPSLQTALDGSYAPLSRPLFIYTLASLMEDPESPVLGFAEFYLLNSDLLVTEVGYVPMSEDLLADQMAKLEAYLP